MPPGELRNPLVAQQFFSFNIKGLDFYPQDAKALNMVSKPTPGGKFFQLSPKY